MVVEIWVFLLLVDMRKSVGKLLPSFPPISFRQVFYTTYMSLETSRTNLENVWQHLNLQWRTVSSVWNDEVRFQFERRYWGMLNTSVPPVLREMDSLSKTLLQARQNVR